LRTRSRWRATLIVIETSQAFVAPWWRRLLHEVVDLVAQGRDAQAERRDERRVPPESLLDGRLRVARGLVLEPRGGVAGGHEAEMRFLSGLRHASPDE
jgi:hypothetical protein